LFALESIGIGLSHAMIGGRIRIETRLAQRIARWAIAQFLGQDALGRCVIGNAMRHDAQAG
jgi:hypothetical protein